MLTSAWSSHSPRDWTWMQQDGFKRYGRLGPATWGFDCWSEVGPLNQFIFWSPLPHPYALPPRFKYAARTLWPAFINLSIFLRPAQWSSLREAWMDGVLGGSGLNVLTEPRWGNAIKSLSHLQTSRGPSACSSGKSRTKGSWANPASRGQQVYGK